VVQSASLAVCCPSPKEVQGAPDLPGPLFYMFESVLSLLGSFLGSDLFFELWTMCWTLGVIAICFKFIGKDF